MIPKHQTKLSAGADLYAAETVTLENGKVRLIPTGFSISELPYESLSTFDMVFMLFNRSSMAKKQVILANGVGVVDQDYKDEIKVMLLNLSGSDVTINKGDRIAQLVPMKYVPFVFEVKQSDRKGGFGSTDK